MSRASARSCWAVWLVGIVAAIACHSDRAREPAPRSETSERCLAGDEEACTLVVAGLGPDARAWGGIVTELCNIGARSFCLTYDAATLARWRAACAAGSYLSCKSATVLQDLIERHALTDVSAARRQLISTWCAGAKPRSLAACIDLVADDAESAAHRAAAYEILQQACARDELAACAAVIRSYVSWVLQATSNSFTHPEREAARTLAEGPHARGYELALSRTARLCARGDWVACGFCGEHRRGYRQDVADDRVERPRRTQLAPPTRRLCDERWLVGARAFRRALAAMPPRP